MLHIGLPVISTKSNHYLPRCLTNNKLTHRLPLDVVWKNPFKIISTWSLTISEVQDLSNVSQSANNMRHD